VKLIKLAIPISKRFMQIGFVHFSMLVSDNSQLIKKSIGEIQAARASYTSCVPLSAIDNALKTAALSGRASLTITSPRGHAPYRN